MAHIENGQLLAWSITTHFGATDRQMLADAEIAAADTQREIAAQAIRHIADGIESALLQRHQH